MSKPTIKVIVAEGTADDVTCYYRLEDIPQFVADVLDSYSSHTVEDALKDMNPRIVEMTVEEFEKVPEL